MTKISCILNKGVGKMLIRKASYTIEPKVDPEEALKFTEKIGRTCYKSEDKIIDSSAKAFVGNIIAHGHEAMIEHYVFVFQVPTGIYNCICRQNLKFVNTTDMQLSRNSFRCIVSASARGLKDAYKKSDSASGATALMNLMRAVVVTFPGTSILFADINIDISEPLYGVSLLTPGEVSNLTIEERMAHQFETVRFICDRGVSHELVRHRRMTSFAQESTRYCNYAKDKFDGSITVIDIISGMKLDSKMKNLSPEDQNRIYEEWYAAMIDQERHYMRMTQLGATPQIARGELSTSTKTEIVMTTNLEEWHHFFTLRPAPAAHPQMRELAVPLLDAFKKLAPGVFDDIQVQEA
jgi:thymidylate synthase (FAD)